MCQDTVKIREEDDLEKDSMENVLKQPMIVRKVLESLDFPSLLQCRIVSKSWEKEATLLASKKCKVTFDTTESLEEFLAILQKASEDSLFSHVIFNFDVESVEAKAGKAVLAFLDNHAKKLSSIETPKGSVSGTDDILDWTTKTIDAIKVKPEEIPAEIVIDENANYVEAPIADENSLQEIVINDEIEEKQVKVKALESPPRKTKSVHFSMVENPEYVPIPYSKEGYENFADFYPYYLGEHSNETGRRLHILGITNSIILIIIGTFTLTPTLYAVAIIQAYALALGAHVYFDKHVPRPTIRNPIYMVMGNLKMWWEVASGQRAL